MNTLITKKQKAFTLVEMLVVLGIISILLLLFVPNLAKQKGEVKQSGDAAVVKVVESQKSLYELKHGKQPTVGELVAEDYISQKQADTYNEYQANAANQ